MSRDYCKRCEHVHAMPGDCPEPPAVPELPEGWRWCSVGRSFVYKYQTHALTLDTLTALLAAQGLHICTGAERKVLEACAVACLCDDDPELCEIEPLEPQEHGEDCYLYTDDQYAIAKAELAKRGVK